MNLSPYQWHMLWSWRNQRHKKKHSATYRPNTRQHIAKTMATFSNVWIVRCLIWAPINSSCKSWSHFVHVGHTLDCEHWSTTQAIRFTQIVSCHSKRFFSSMLSSLTLCIYGTVYMDSTNRKKMFLEYFFFILRWQTTITICIKDHYIASSIC